MRYRLLSLLTRPVFPSLPYLAKGAREAILMEQATAFQKAHRIAVGIGLAVSLIAAGLLAWVAVRRLAPQSFATSQLIGVTLGLAFGWAYLLVLAAIVRKRVLSELKARGLCGACGYDLTENISGTCPECGGKVG